MLLWSLKLGKRMRDGLFGSGFAESSMISSLATEALIGWVCLNGGALLWPVSFTGGRGTWNFALYSLSMKCCHLPT
jgi:hypothetical protein